MAFITTLYREVLGREPEAFGLAYWLQRLATDKTPAAAGVSFFESRERRTLVAYRTAPGITQPQALADALRAEEEANVPASALTDPGPIALVTTLYKEIPDRTPDAVGEHSSLEQLAIGTTPAEVALDLFDSPEHKALQRSHQAPKTSERTALADALRAETQAVTVSSVVPSGPIKSV